MVICLERGADLHMAQLMPLPLTVSEKGPLNVCVCVYRARHYTRVMVECRPVEPGCYTGILCLLASTGVKLNVPLTAQCVRETAI